MLARWNTVSRDSWSFRREQLSASTIVFALRRLPDFSAPRFDYLAKEKDARAAKVGQLQLQMLRQLFGLGENWAMSLRLVKDHQLTLYLVFRWAESQPMEPNMLEGMKENIAHALLRNEYTFAYEQDASEAFDVSWANEVVGILKQQEEYRGAKYPTGEPPREFYVPYSWQATDNNMEHICNALMAHQGRASVEITLIPTSYLPDERDWMNVNIEALRDSANGEIIRSSNGRILWQGEKLPILKPALDNCEKMNKQYESSRLFLSGIHVFADRDARSLADALMVTCVRNQGETFFFSRGSKPFDHLAGHYKTVDIPVDVVSGYWRRHAQSNNLPFRAQRLQRLVSIEEAGNFFRIPIPVQAGFPGFGLDTGLGETSARKSVHSGIDVGSYLDEVGQNGHAVFDVQQFAKHGLIVGVPGSGKTTAMFSILYQLWDANQESRIPFIVLEPAKTEYRALKTLPIFKDDLLVFTLGDEDASPFRFNPMEVLPGIRLENHISRLQACFVGAFDLFDPLPIFLEQAIRRTYLEQGWYDDSRGGEPGLVTPTLADLCRNASYIVEHSGFDPKMKSDFKASLLERLNSLRRGSKGRMLDCRTSIPMEDLMGRPVILELDSLNGDEKSLMMMFLLSYVFEYCKVKRVSGSPLRHLLVVEEAHNLISSQGGDTTHANPKEQTIELFVNMLAEMRALGQGILIADQLPTAIAPQAVKQTNVKLLMRVTARDDREEIGNTMDLNEDQMHQVVNFKTGHAYLYHEGEDRVRMIRMPNFKAMHEVEEPPSDAGIKSIMADYELAHRDLYLPFAECATCCHTCNRRVRNQVESFIQRCVVDAGVDVYKSVFHDQNTFEQLKAAITLCGVCNLATRKEYERIKKRYGAVGECFGACAYVHLIHLASEEMTACKKRFNKKCNCGLVNREGYLQKFAAISKGA